MENTIHNFRELVKNGLSIDEIADIFIKRYYKPDDDFPIVSILNNLNCSTFCVDVDSWPITPEIINKPKCFILGDTQVKERYNSDYAIAVSEHMGIIEHKFWFAYCLGYLLYNDVTALAMFSNVDKLSDYYKFAIKVTLPFIQ